MKLMKLNGALVILMLMACSQAGTIAGEGNGSSGGGGAFVCRSDDTILSAQSQDIWNAEYKGLTLESSDSTFGMNDETRLKREKILSYQLLKKLISVSPVFYDDVKAALDKIYEIREIRVVKFRPLGDSPHFKEPFNCSVGVSDYLPAAIYIDENPDKADREELTYSQNIVEKFQTVLDWSGLALHEAVYKVLRTIYNDIDSKRSQDIVGGLVSIEGIAPALAGVIPLSEFIPSSNKSLKKKYEQLVDIFNRGVPVTFEDMENMNVNCFSVSKEMLKERTKMMQPKIKNRLRLHANGGKTRANGSLRISGADYLYDGMSFLGTASGTNVFGLKELPKDINAKGAFSHVALTATDSSTFAAGSYYVHKDNAGNLVLIFGTTLCLKGPIFGKCKEYKQYNELAIASNFTIREIVYCPKVE